MQFERGKDPKEALKIGLKANPIHCEGVAEIKVEKDIEFSNRTVRVSKFYEIVRGASHHHRVLMGIEAMELNPEEFALVMFGNEDTHHQPFDVRTESYIDLVDILGKFVKYKDYTYYIPTLDEFRKRNRQPLPNLRSGCNS